MHARILIARLAKRTVDGFKRNPGLLEVFGESLTEKGYGTLALAARLFRVFLTRV
jgi:hypothetical protein